MFEDKYTTDKSTGGIKKYDSYHFDEDLMASLGIGKKVSLKNDISLSIYLRQEFKALFNTNTVIGVSVTF